MPNTIADLYIVKVRVTTGAPGAPVLILNLAVHGATGEIPNGKADITQVTAPPFNEIHVSPVHGVVHHTGLGVDTRLVAVSGQYVQTANPPLIGAYLANFSAALAVDEGWNGKGSFSYGGVTITNAAVTKID